MQLGHNYIGTEHMLLGLVREGEGVGAQVLISSGADLSRVRQQVIQLLSGYSAVGDAKQAPSATGVGIEVNEPPWVTAPSGTAPDCPHCRSSLERVARVRPLTLPGTEGTNHNFLVVYCGACDRALAFKPIG
jgi:hypothetical protein